MQTSTKHLEVTLRNIGFNDKEAKVYLALLQLGPTDAKQISQKSGIKKPTTYVILDELRQKDAVLFLPNAKKKLFAAKNPEEIFDIAQRRIKQATANLPLLQELAHRAKDNAMVTYYEGKNAYAQAMRYKEKEVIQSGEMLCYFASPEKIHPAMLASVDSLMTKLKNNGVKIRAFASQNKNLERYRKEDKEHNRETKVLPPEIYKAYSSIDINDSFVRFVLFGEEKFVIIDNVEIARIMKQIFEMNWSKY